jgi:hypothetical protein
MPSISSCCLVAAAQCTSTTSFKLSSRNPRKAQSKNQSCDGEFDASCWWCIGWSCRVYSVECRVALTGRILHCSMYLCLLGGKSPVANERRSLASCKRSGTRDHIGGCSWSLNRFKLERDFENADVCGLADKSSYAVYRSNTKHYRVAADAEGGVVGRERCVVDVASCRRDSPLAERHCERSTAHGHAAVCAGCQEQRLLCAAASVRLNAVGQVT